MAVNFREWAAAPRLVALCAVVALTSACAPPSSEVTMLSARPDLMQPGLNPNFVAKAVGNAKAKRAKGQKVWCVPFARDASGVQIKGDAGTWWDQAKGKFQRGNQPLEGAVMAFSSTRKLPKGHIAVVSQVVSDREILIDHANWKPSQVSLGMSVVDVSTKNDWSVVKVASSGDTLGRAYPVDGFIWKAPQNVVQTAASATIEAATNAAATVEATAVKAGEVVAKTIKLPTAEAAAETQLADNADQAAPAAE